MASCEAPISALISEDGEVGYSSLTAHSHSYEVHVLAVDDSVLDRKMIEKLLRTSSYKVTTVDSGNKALEVLGIEGGLGLQINISLIITDYCMPGMTGYDLLKRVKGSAALKEIPVVIMSSENVPNRIQSCLDEGAEEFILKPVQVADVERLRSHIRPSQKASCVDQPSIPCNKRKFGSEALQEERPQKVACVDQPSIPCNKRKFGSLGPSRGEPTKAGTRDGLIGSMSHPFAH